MPIQLDSYRIQSIIYASCESNEHGCPLDQALLILRPQGDISVLLFTDAEGTEREVHYRLRVPVGSAVYPFVDD